MSDAFTLIAGKPTIIKDPNAVLDYTVDFTAWLLPAADTISSHTVTVTGGIVKDSSGVVGGNKVTMWVSGGVAGTPASATVRIITTGGRTDDRTVYFKLKER
jgi:hypothetical protein